MMFRRLLRLIHVMLPAIVVAAAWAAWWVLGDGPIKISRPNFPFRGTNPQPGRTTIIERECPMGVEVRGVVYWRSYESGECIIDPELLRNNTAVITKDDNTLIAFKDESPVRLFDRATGQIRAELPPVHSAAYHRNRCVTKNVRTLAYGTTAGELIVVDVPTGQVVHRILDLQTPVGLSEDGRFIVAARGRQTLVLRDLQTGNDLAQTPCQDTQDLVEPVVGPGGRRILLTTLLGYDATDEIWSSDPPGRQVLATRRWGSSADLCASGRYARIPSSGKATERYWDLAPWPSVEITSRLVFQKRGPMFSDDGKWVVVSNESGTNLEILDAGTFTVHSTIPKRYDKSAAWFDQDSRYVMVLDISTQFDWVNQLANRILEKPIVPTMMTRVYDVATGSHLRTLASWGVYSITDDGATAWVKSNRTRGPHGVYELWSLTPPRPPWWLWTLTVLGLLALIYNIRRRYWPAANASAKRR
jgi:hypothetical protein